MTFTALIDRIRDGGDVLELPATEDDVPGVLRDFFETHNVDIRQPPTRNTSDEQVVLYRDDEPVACDPLEVLVEYVRGVDLDLDSDPNPAGTDGVVPDVIAEARTVVVPLTDAARDRMLQGSRQIEKLAWRSRTGTIHAGFQELSVFAAHDPTERLYRGLARSGVTVHIYGQPDEEIEAEPGLTVHEQTNEAVTSTWFIAYTTDAGPQAALLAQEREPDRYTGFWTFAPGLATDVLSAIESDLLQPA